jgi:hypothetical protein
MSTVTEEISSVVSVEEQRLRLDEYRMYMRMLDKHMVSVLSREDSENPVWDAKTLFNCGLESFGKALCDI